MDVERLIERLAVIADTSFLDHAAADDLREAAAALAKLQAERDEAREALRPFANLGAALPEHYSHDSRFHGPGHPRFWYEIDPKNIWKARSVIDRAASRALGGGE